MFLLQKAMSQLRLAVTATAEYTTRYHQKCLAAKKTGITANQIKRHPLLLTFTSQTVYRMPVLWYSTNSTSKKAESGVAKKSYDPPSPYRNPGPRRYGYEPKFFTGGLLPRGLMKPIKCLPKFKPKDKWCRKNALFGQNDFIDILGDGSVQPSDLLIGPDWLVGFKGNELQRLTRRVKFQGEKLKLLYPNKFHNIHKRIFFLYKKYNQKRGKRVPSG